MGKRPERPEPGRVTRGYEGAAAHAARPSLRQVSFGSVTPDVAGSRGSRGVGTRYTFKASAGRSTRDDFSLGFGKRQDDR